MDGESQTNDTSIVWVSSDAGEWPVRSMMRSEADRVGSPSQQRLAEAYRQAGRTKVVAVADIDQAKLDAFSARWGVHRLYTDYHRMLENEDLDIVSVATHANGKETSCSARMAGPHWKQLWPFITPTWLGARKSACPSWIRPQSYPTRSINP